MSVVLFRVVAEKNEAYTYAALVSFLKRDDKRR